MKITDLFAEQKELRALGAEIAKIAEKEGRGLNALEEKRLSDLESRISAIDTAIETELRSPVPGTVPRFQHHDLPEGEDRGSKKIVSARAFFAAMSSDPELRAMASTVAGTPKFISEVLEIIAESNPMRQLANVITIQGDAVIPVPGSATAAWATEAAVIAPADVAVTPVALSSFTLHGGVTVNDAMLADNFGNIEAMVRNAAGKAIGEAEGTAMLGSGAGASSPQGLFNAGTNVQTATTATVTLADFINFLGSLETKWKTRGKHKILLSPSVMAALINLKDNTGKLELDSRSSVINGIPFVLSSLAPAYATTTLTKLLAMGDFERAYTIAQRTGDNGAITTKVVPLTTSFQNNVLFMERVDGRVVDSAAYKVWQVK